MEIHENKTVVCRYLFWEYVVQEYADFGWSLSNKILLDCFGKPVPYGVIYNEGDLKEKCSYELHFMRVLDSEKAISLNELQNECTALEFKPEKFSKRRVKWVVWLSILFSFCLFFFISWRAMEQYDAAGNLLLPLIFLGGGCLNVVLSGCRKISKVKKQNDEIFLQKQQLAEQAKKILEATEVL